MAIINDVTINYSIPMPNIANDVVDDMTRLRAAFTNIDTYLLSKADKSDTYTKSQVETIAATILTATSASSVAIGTGSKTFTTQANKQYAVGQFLIISSTANPTNFMFGQVTSYSTTTLVVNVLVAVGSGTLASWNIAMSGVQGLQGNTGATGAQGIQGVAGATGATGATGTAGATWLSGSGVPAAGTGVNNDYYFRTDTSDIYKKVSGAWGSPIANIKGATGSQGIQGVAGATGATGAQGIQGATGATGAAGIGGATWLSGSGAPAAGTGANNDYYFRTDTSDIYKKAAGAWGSPIANIKGATGAAGSQGIAGVNGATWLSGTSPTGGFDGDYYFKTDTSDIYKKVSGSWGSPIANIKGATGATGAQGVQGVAGTNGINGATWLSGTSPTGGVDGDYYFKTDTCDIYKKVSGSWGSPIANIKGADGAGGGSSSLEWTGAVPAFPASIALSVPSSFAQTDCCILVDKNDPNVSTILFETGRVMVLGILVISYNQGYADFGNLTSRTWLVIPQNQTMRLRDWGVATDFPANAIPRVETGSGVNWITYAHLKTINGQSLFSYVDGENITTTPATQPLTITATNANYLPFFIRIPPRATEVNGVIQAASPTDKWVESVTWTGGAMTSISFDDLKGVGANFAPASMSSLTSLSLPALISVGTIFNPNTMSSLTSLSLPELVNVGGVFSPNGMALTSLSLPELVNVGGAFNPYNMASLTSISFGRIERIGMSATSGSIFYLTSGTANVTTLDVPATLKQIGIAAGNVVLTSCKLNQASVDNLLVRLAALDGTNGTVTFNGRTVTITGTSSTPSATGLAAKATLVARGCTVTHN